MRHLCILALAAAVLFGGLAVISRYQHQNHLQNAKDSSVETPPVTVSVNEGARILID